MGNFSKDPLQVLADNLAQSYLGVHLQQGVPVLDRDINLMQDLLRALVRSLATVFLGNGILPSNPPPHNGFRISILAAANNDFTIAPGSALAEGVTVNLTAPRNYSVQVANPALPPLTTPSPAQPDPREDQVYLDVWLREVTAADDANLRNDDDIGIETSVRLQPTFLVRVAEGTPIPAPLSGHVHVPLATFRRPRGNAAILAAHIIDARVVLATLPKINDRLGVLESALNPAITGITPTFQNVINNVTLNGNNFAQGTPTVTFIPINPPLAPLPGTIVSFNNSQIVVTVPDFPGVNPAGIQMSVRVQTAIGSVDSAAATPLTIVDSSGPPTITTITPPFQNVGNTITITGTSLGTIATTSVLFSPAAGLLPLPVNGIIVSVTATTIIVTVPNFAGTSPVTGWLMRVRVTTPVGSVDSIAAGPTSLTILDAIV